MQEGTIHKYYRKSLNWWHQNYERYPSLASIAKYLCIPATSVPLVSVSTADDIVTAQRSQLKPKHVDTLIFLKNNWNTFKFMNSKESHESLGRDETPRHACHKFFTSI